MQAVAAVEMLKKLHFNLMINGVVIVMTAKLHHGCSRGNFGQHVMRQSSSEHISIMIRQNCLMLAARLVLDTFSQASQISNL
jgi:hypothetical protein